MSAAAQKASVGPSEEASATGGRTLEMFTGTPKLNAWMFSKFSAHIRGDVLEVGSGIGNISSLIIQQATSAVLTDIEPHYVEHLKATFADGKRVQVSPFDLSVAPPELIASRTFDAIVAINVIEHIHDDAAAARTLFGLLKPGGYLLAYVPACPWAFGSLDEALGHHRRYTPDSFSSLLSGAGFNPGPIRYMNILGLPGWFMNGRLFKRRVLPAKQVALFERLVSVARLEDRVRLPIGLGVVACAQKPA